MAERTAGLTQRAGAAVLDEAAARNAPIELRSLGRDGRPIQARARILGADDGRLLLDQPQCAGQPVVFRSGQALDVRLRLNDLFYSFKSDVQDVSRLLRLNERKKVIGMVISRPHEVHVAQQRRSHFRVRLLDDDPVVLDLHEAVAGGSGTCPIDALRFRADLVNLSAGGAGVRIPKEWAGNVCVGDLLFSTFTLPEEDGAFSFLVTVREVFPVPETGAERVGLQILDWPNPRDVERTRQRLQRSLTRVQRTRLKRTR